MARFVFIPRLPAFQALHPNVEIELGSSDRFVDLVREGVDFAVRGGALVDSPLTVRPIAELPHLNVASPAYLARHGTPRTLEDLAAHYVIGYAPQHGAGTTELEHVKDGRTLRLRMRSRITVNNGESYLDACLAGQGIGQVPAYGIARELERGELVSIMPQHTAMPMPLALVYPHRRVTLRARALMDWLYDVLRSELLRFASA